MGQDFTGTLLPQQIRHDPAGLGTDLHRRGIVVVGLADIGVFKALVGSQGVSLGYSCLQFPLFEFDELEPDYDELIDLIFDFDEVVSWW